MYGIPYQGSKNRIAKKIVDLLPPAEVLVDVFAGGCAVTHAALESGKFRTVIANDIGPGPAVFHAAASGRLPIRPRWVSRDEFFKTDDPVVKYCYSFANDAKSYLYSRDIEPLNHALHKAVVEGDFSLFPADIQENLRQAIAGKASLHARRIAAQTAARQAPRLKRCDIEHLTRLERIQRIQNVSSSNLLVTQRDYRDVHIPNDAVVYCDPPYACTAGYSIAFNHDEFYWWCRAVAKFHKVYVSEYQMPADFKCIAEFEVRALAGASTNSQIRIEKLFTLG